MPTLNMTYYYLYDMESIIKFIWNTIVTQNFHANWSFFSEFVEFSMLFSFVCLIKLGSFKFKKKRRYVTVNQGMFKNEVKFTGIITRFVCFFFSIIILEYVSFLGICLCVVVFVNCSMESKCKYQRKILKISFKFGFVYFFSQTMKSYLFTDDYSL